MYVPSFLVRQFLNGFQTDFMGNSLKLIGIVLKDALKLFLENDPLKMAGATAFFTMFALPPILIILVQFFSLFIDPQTIRHELFVSLSDIFGKEAVRQIVSVIRAVKKLSYNWVATAFGFIVRHDNSSTLLSKRTL